MQRNHATADEDQTTGTFVRTPRGLQPSPKVALIRSVGAAPPNPFASEGLWDVGDVARYLKVSRSWVYHRAEAGLMPHLRVGGLLRFDPDGVRVFARKK